MARMHVGDLILRAGRGLDALAVKVESNAPMSHIGIVVGELASGKFLIAHADPGTRRGYGTVRLTTEQEFLAPESAAAFEVWRPNYPNSTVRSLTVSYALASARRHQPFDDRFSMQSDHAAYCTELVIKALDRSGFHWRVRPTASSVPGFDEAIYLPSELQKTGDLVLVAQGQVLGR